MKYIATQLYAMKLHIVYTTKNRGKLYNDEKMWLITEETIREICERENIVIYQLEKGVPAPLSEREYEDCAIHLYIKLQSNVSPEELVTEIKKTSYERMRQVKENLKNPFTKDFLITDDEHFQYFGPYQFVELQSWHTAKGGGERLNSMKSYYQKINDDKGPSTGSM